MEPGTVGQREPEMDGSDSGGNRGPQTGSTRGEAEIEAAGIELARLWAEAKAEQTRTVRDALATIETKPEPRPKGRLAAWCGDSSSWSLSAVIHLALLLLLGTLGLSADQTPDRLMLTAAIEPLDPIELQNAPLEDRPGDVEVVPSMALPDPPDDPGLGDLGASPDTALDMGAEPIGPLALPGELGTLFGQGDTGLATAGAGRSGAEFFGLKADGNKFAFVVDGSVSMHRNWEACRRELTAAVARLEKHQRFYVILFNSRPRPMFSDEDPQPQPVPATPENLARLKRWLDEFSLRSGTRPQEAMRFVLPMRPDAIYFLTDGELHDDTEEFLRNHNVRQDGPDAESPASTVHTIGFHSEKGRDVLKRIAEENGGEFRSVGEPQDPDGETQKGREKQ